MSQISAPSDAIAPGRFVRLHLAVFLEDGTEALSSFDAEPIACTIGDGTLAPGLERLLIGLDAGSDTRILTDGAEVYGTPDPDLIQTLPASDLPPELDLEPGQVVAFTAPGGQETTGTVVAVGDAGVRVDFNHPFARHGLEIRALVIAVE